MDLRKATTKSLSAILLLAFTAAPLAAAIAPAPRGCDALQKWALDHRQELPKDYEGLLAYPFKERQAIYSQLSAAEKAAFWHQKIAVYLEDHRELTAAQAAAIRKTAAAITPEIYGQDMAGKDPLAAAEQEARAALGDEIVEGFFYGLGPELGVQTSVSGEIRAGGFGDQCNCASIVDCPRPMFNQCDPWWGCTGATPTGCGGAGTKPCSKICTWVP